MQDGGERTQSAEDVGDRDVDALCHADHRARGLPQTAQEEADGRACSGLPVRSTLPQTNPLQVTKEEVGEAYKMFYDTKRSEQYLKQNSAKFLM